MALLGNSDAQYNRTGNTGLTRFTNGASYIPVIGGIVAGTVGFLGTVLESARWLLRGKLLSAATVFTAGTVSNAVNVAKGASEGIFPVMWFVNVGSGITTGRTIGTHARKLTETAIGGVTGALGVKPQVLRSYPAAIGSIGGGMAQPAPGPWMTKTAQSRGEDPNAAYARLNSNQSDHLSALQAAQGQGGYRGM